CWLFSGVPRQASSSFCFQAEDGIRYDLVTGVQTCALPISLPCGSDGFRGLLESFELRAMLQFGNVQQNNEASLQFADACDVSGFAFRKDAARGFDLGGRNLQDLRSRVDDESDQLVVQLDDEDTIPLVVLNLGLAEPLAKVHDGNDFPAEVDDTFDQIGSAGDRSNLRYTHNLSHSSNANTVRFIANAKTDELKLFF